MNDDRLLANLHTLSASKIELGGREKETELLKSAAGRLEGYYVWCYYDGNFERFVRELKICKRKTACLRPNFSIDDSLVVQDLVTSKAWV